MIGEVLFFLSGTVDDLKYEIFPPINSSPLGPPFVTFLPLFSSRVFRAW